MYGQRVVNEHFYVCTHPILEDIQLVEDDQEIQIMFIVGTS
jgi:hypothetical protein